MVQTLEKLYRTLREQLQQVTRSPAQATAEADWIIEAVLGEKPEAVYRAGDMPVAPEQAKMIDYLLHDRVQKRIPIQYLLHQAWFYGLKLYVNPHVLIPRPETELLVEEALRLATPGARILDVGTGPGSIALALAHALKARKSTKDPQSVPAKATKSAATLVALDVSPEALHVARINAKSLGVQVAFLESDLFSSLPDTRFNPEERFDLIVSNPPYVDPALKPTLDAEVLQHEPALALFPPTDDPYHFYHRLAAEAPAYLTPGGHLLLEVGAGMAEEVRAILDSKGWKNTRLIPDYAGIDRVACGCLSGKTL